MLFSGYSIGIVDQQEARMDTLEERARHQKEEVKQYHATMDQIAMTNSHLQERIDMLLIDHASHEDKVAAFTKKICGMETLVERYKEEVLHIPS